MAAFVQAELVPFHADWEKQQRVPREVWRKAGEAGLLCPDVPEEFGGYGADWLYNVVIIEELAKAGMSGPGFMVHSEMVAPYIRTWGSDELKRKWLPRMVTGEAIGVVAMTEPGAGSDLKELRTRAARDGDHYVINGQKNLHLERTELRLHPACLQDRSRRRRARRWCMAIIVRPISWLSMASSARCSIGSSPTSAIRPRISAGI